MVAVMSEGSTVRSHRNRAVAAVAQVDAALTESALISSFTCNNLSLEKNNQGFWESKLSIMRYKNFEELLEQQLRPDPHAEARASLLKLQTIPVMRDNFAVLDDNVLRIIYSFLGDYSRDVMYLSGVCRRLRRFIIAMTPSNAVIVPTMIPLHLLSSHTIVDGLCAFFSPQTRGQLVRHLRLCDSKYAATLSVRVVPPVCSSHIFPSLVKSMPRLTFLDLRGVIWEELPKYFFSDLHCVAPRLQTLKIGIDLFLSPWTPGWWQRLPALEEIVVGSRRDQAILTSYNNTTTSSPSPLSVPKITKTTLATSQSTTTIGGIKIGKIIMHDDMIDMLRTPNRSWRLKLWCALPRETLIRILLPSQPFPELQELTLNLSNMDILEELKQPQTRSPRESKTRKPTRKTNVNPAEDAEQNMYFPALQSLTLANVDQTSSLSAELLERMAIRAPKLKFFTIVNTAKVPPPPKLKRRI